MATCSHTTRRRRPLPPASMHGNPSWTCARIDDFSPRACARLDEGIEEDAVRIACDELELPRHPIDDVLRDLARIEQCRRARQQQLGPVREKLGAFAGRAIVEMKRAHVGRYIAEANRLQQVAELRSDERIAAE